MLRIGLTGGIGAGKSAACQLFNELGIPVIDADQVSREVVAPGEPALATIAAQFGATLLSADGTLDRKRLREMIFTKPALRQQLETILHPLIKLRITARLEALQAPYVILAIPLLLEANWQDLVDRVLVIDCPVEQQVNRTMKRDHLSRHLAEAIIAAQMDRNERLRKANDIVSNDDDLEHLRRQIINLHQHYLSLAASSRT